MAKKQSSMQGVTQNSTFKCFLQSPSSTGLNTQDNFKLIHSHTMECLLLIASERELYMWHVCVISIFLKFMSI